MNNKITKRLFIYTLCFSSFMTLVLTALQLNANYRQEVVNLEQKIELVRFANMDNIKNSLFSFNRQALARQLQGMLRVPNIIYIEIQDEQGTVVAQAGTPQVKNILRNNFSIPHLSQDPSKSIGSVHITATLAGIYQQLWSTWLVVLASQALKIFFISFCIFFIFKWFVIGDLVKLVDKIKDFDPVEDDQLIFQDKQTNVTENDIFDRLVGSINSMQKKLQVSNQELHSTLEILERAQQVAKIGNWCWDLVRDVTTWSDELCRIVGISQEEYDGTYEIYLSCIHPEDKEQFQALTKRILKEKGAYHEEYRLVRKNDGAVLYVREEGLVTVDANGNPTSILGTIQDITERKKAELSLKENEERFRTLVENVPGIVYRCNLPAPWKVQHISEDVYALTGYPQQDFLQDKVTFGQLIAAEDLPLVEKEVADGIAEFRPYMVEYSIHHADGSRRFFYEKGRAIYDQERNPLWLDGVIIDISDRKRAEEEKSTLLKQLLHAQKSEAIGTLASGIAHDFNNILSSIMGYTELVLLDLPEEEATYQDLKQVYAAAIRARDLIRQILTFSRSGEENKMPQDVGLIVREALKLLRSSLPTSIDIRQDINMECKKIMADASQLHQIVMNLCTNAFHAMEEGGGVLSVALQQVRLTEADLVNDNQHEPGDYVRLIVRDTGKGISPENVDRIFEPYFTTKTQDKGTGLGLALVQGIVHRHNGMVSLKSTEGEGTEFTVFFPAISTDCQVPQQEDIRKVLPGGSENILVVDDEVPIAQMVKKVLRQLGYNVTAFTSSVEALDCFSKDPQSFDLLITDQTMPGLVGIELIQKVLQIRPDLPSILCTGYSSQVTTDNYLNKGIRKMLMKPMESKTLAYGVREVLDGE